MHIGQKTNQRYVHVYILIYIYIRGVFKKYAENEENVNYKYIMQIYK